MTKELGRFVVYGNRRPSHYERVCGVYRDRNFIEFWFRGHHFGIAK